MTVPILNTKLYIPPPRTNVVFRNRLIERLNAGLHRKLTLISAPAGFGKTTLVSTWIANSFRPTAWLSLDEGDNDPTRFLTYVIRALQTIMPNFGTGVLATLQSPQTISTESLLTNLLNEISTVPEKFILVLDDYHVIDAQAVDQVLTFLLDHLPPQMHVVISSREDPPIPVARLRVRDQLNQMRISDLRFTEPETAEFLNEMMGLNLSTADVIALETRTEGWIAGIQLAAISMQGQQDTTNFIKSFTGGHHFVLDYLVEEVLQRQPETVQTFLLRTSILDRLCGSLCSAVVLNPSVSGQETLEYIERSNLFIIPLDDQRKWYRYHHLFADLLRQRLNQSLASSSTKAGWNIADAHKRASVWYEENGFEVEAFQHATAANDFARAERLIEGNGMPLHFRGVVFPILNWLKSLPITVCDSYPSLWTVYASVLLVTGQKSGVEQKLQAAETALHDKPLDDQTRDLIGRIAAIRATLASNQNEVETIIAQSRRALEYLHPQNLAFRTSTLWKLGFAYQLQGDRAAATEAYKAVIAIGQASGNTIFTLMAKTGMATLQEADNCLYLADATYRQILQAVGDQHLPFSAEVHFGLARIHYEWNDFNAVQHHVQQYNQLTQSIEKNERLVSFDKFLARLKLAQGDVHGASAILAQTLSNAREQNYLQSIPEIAEIQVLILLRQGNITAAADLAQTYRLPFGQARVHLAKGDPATALEILAQEVTTKDWQDVRLKVLVLQSLAFQANGENEKAIGFLAEALALAEPGGFVRTFVDEGMPMAQLLARAGNGGLMPDYVAKLLAVFERETSQLEAKFLLPTPQPLREPLSHRELEVLKLIAQGLSNQEICQQLFLALDTVKGHNRRIFDKLQVQRRTEAVARARELGLL
jgi:LuxR family maltose regulon positive regulatory protein